MTTLHPQVMNDVPSFLGHANFNKTAILGTQMMGKMAIAALQLSNVVPAAQAELLEQHTLSSSN